MSRKYFRALILLYVVLIATGCTMNADEKRMSEWLAHPNEFGEPPLAIEEIHRESTQWPLEDGPVDFILYLFFEGRL